MRTALAAALADREDVRLALLFGSQARGRAGAGSDVDVAVLAPGVDGLELASELSHAIGREVDVIALEDPSVPLLAQLVRDSIVVHEGVPGAAASWRARALLALEIDGPWYARMRDAWLARVAERGL
jgi:predicted nucleotidyltransferase